MTGAGWAVRYVFTAQPMSNRPNTVQSTSCSCLVNKFTVTL